MSRPSAVRVKKDALLELVSRDIKELQRAQSDANGERGNVDVFTNSSDYSQLLCDHLDHVMMHGLREFGDGYWPFVSYFTRRELIHSITHLRRVTTSLGKGRSWLYTALNEQSIESYVRMFAENQNIVQEFYLRDAFLRDIEHLLLLLTLVAGLDFISFQLEVDCEYLDYGASQLSSRISSQGYLEVQPSFLSAKVDDVVRSRAVSDPTPRLPRAVSRPKKKDRRTRKGNISEGHVGTQEPQDTSHVETESQVMSSSQRRASSESIRIASSAEEGTRSTTMSSSLQMTSSSLSRNVLERMGSLESRSPFLERRSREASEGVRGDSREGGEDEVLVSKGRRSGRGRKRRKKKDESKYDEHPSQSSPQTRRDHVTEHQSHMTQHESHVTILELGVDTGMGEEGGVVREENYVEVLVTEECDFEMEPKHAVSGDLSPLLGGREGERGGGGMSLEMELALATRDIDRPTTGDTCQELRGDGDKELNRDGVIEEHRGWLPVRNGIESRDDVSGDLGEGVHQLEPSHFASETAPFEVLGEEDSQLSVPHTGGNPFGDVDDDPSPPPPGSLPHRLTEHTHHQRHTAPHHTSHHPHNSDRSMTGEQSLPHRHKSKLKSLSASLPESSSRRMREMSPQFDRGFDVITQREVREVTERRPRADAVFAEEREGEGEGEGETGKGRVFVKKRAEGDKGQLHLTHSMSTSKGQYIYEGPPRRPQYITERDRVINDIKIDETMKVVFSIDVFLSETDRQSTRRDDTRRDGAKLDDTRRDGATSDRQQRVSQHSEEEAVRLVQVNTPVGLGHYRTGYVLVTTEAVYMLRRDGIEGIFSREFGVRYNNIDHLVIGLGWQSLELVYREPTSARETEELESCVLLTGSEAVSRSLMDSLQAAATSCRGFRRVLPKNRDDENRVEAIERELIKLGSETNMDMMQYSFVNWEQVKGEIPESLRDLPGKEVKSGLLYYKSTTMLGLSSWKQAFFKLTDRALHQFNNETDKVSRGVHPLSECGGCTRVSGESRPFVLSVALDNTQPLLLATTSEDDLIQWQQSLCEAVLQVPSVSHHQNLMCTVLLTKTQVHILQEDLSRGTVHHITFCEVTSVEMISVDRSLPLYCAVSYDDGEVCKGMWLLCFNSEYELGKFEAALGNLWKEQFQIDLPFSELEDEAVLERAHHTVDLVQASSLRSDSITKGRTEFNFSSDI